MIGRAVLIAAALLAGGEAGARCVTPTLDERQQNANRDFVGQDLDTILERGRLTIAVYADFAPYAWEEDGVLRGVDVEIGRLIAATLGVAPEFHIVPAAETVDADLLNNIVRGYVIGGSVSNVMLHVPINTEFACRNDMAVLTGAYFDETIAIAYRRTDFPEEAPLPGSFRFHTVAVENDSLADFYLSSLGNGILIPQIRRFPTPDAAMRALAGGEVKAVMGARAQLEHGAVEGVAVHAPPLPGLALGTWTVGAAVRTTYRDLGYAVDDAVQAAIADGRIAAIFARYGLTWRQPQG